MLWRRGQRRGVVFKVVLLVFLFLSLRLLWRLTHPFTPDNPHNNYEKGFDLVASSPKHAPFPKLVFWLHIPKTGSSLCLLLLHHVCLRPHNATHLFSEKTVHGFMSAQEHGAVAQKAFVAVRAHCPLDAFYHPPFGHVPLPRELRTHRRALTMIRHPFLRLRSAYAHGRHHSGMQEARVAELERVTTLSEYARFPGIAGCQTKMLLGWGCAEEIALSEADARSAADLLEHAFVFVGVTDRWADSVTLFHAMHGGNVLPFELTNLRPSHPLDHQTVDERGVGGKSEGGGVGRSEGVGLSLDGGEGEHSVDIAAGELDPLDMIVYRRALVLFETRLAQHGVTKD